MGLSPLHVTHIVKEWVIPKKLLLFPRLSWQDSQYWKIYRTKVF